MYLNQDLAQNLLICYRFNDTGVGGTGVYNYGNASSSGYVQSGLSNNAHWLAGSGMGGTTGFYSSGQATIRTNLNYAPTGDFSLFSYVSAPTGIGSAIYIFSTQTPAGFGTAAFLFNVNNGGFLSMINAEATAVSPIAIPLTAGTSAFVGCTYQKNTSTLRYYISGNYVGSGSVAFPIAGKVAQPLLACGSDSAGGTYNAYNAIFDNMFVFSRALTSGEVLSLYNSTLTTSSANVSCADLGVAALTSRTSDVLSRLSGPDASLFSINSLGDLTFNNKVNALTPIDANLDGTYTVNLEEFNLSYWNFTTYNIRPYKRVPPLRGLVRAAANRRAYNPPNITGVAASSGTWSGYNTRFNDYTYYG